MVREGTPHRLQNMDTHWAWTPDKTEESVCVCVCGGMDRDTNTPSSTYQFVEAVKQNSNSKTKRVHDVTKFPRLGTDTQTLPGEGG